MSHFQPIRKQCHIVKQSANSFTLSANKRTSHCQLIRKHFKTVSHCQPIREQFHIVNQSENNFTLSSNQRTTLHCKPITEQLHIVNQSEKNYTHSISEHFVNQSKNNFRMLPTRKQCHIVNHF